MSGDDAKNISCHGSTVPNRLSFKKFDYKILEEKRSGVKLLVDVVTEQFSDIQIWDDQVRTF